MEGVRIFEVFVSDEVKLLQLDFFFFSQRGELKKC